MTMTTWSEVGDGIPHGLRGSGQLLTPGDDLLSRVIVGTCSRRGDWMARHDDPAFLHKRAVLEGEESAPDVTRWFSVVADARVGGQPR